MIFTNLRKYTKTIMWVIAIFIVPAFVIWNIGSAVRERRSGFAGKLFDKKVTWKEFTLEQHAARNDALLKYGENADDKINIDEQTWTRMILLHEAKKRNIRVNNDELLAYIRQIPLFQYGQLDAESYGMIIGRVFQESPAEFEDGIRHSLMIGKLLGQIGADITASDAEIKFSYANEFAKASAKYILIEPQTFEASVSLDNAEAIKNYYENHKEEFKTPERVIVEYIAIKLDRYKEGIEITDEKIKKYYDANKTQFITQNNEPAAEAPAAATASIGYKSIDEVKDTIIARLTEKETADRAMDVARQIITKLYSDTNLSGIAGEYGLTAEKTAPFSMLEEIPDVGVSFPFIKAAFSLNVGEVSEIIRTPTALYILKPVKKIAPYIPAFEEAAQKAGQSYQKAEARKLAHEKSNAVRLKLISLIKEKGMTFDQAAADQEYTVKQANDFTRAGYVNELGFAQEFTKAAFALAPQELSEVVNTPRGFAIIMLDKITPIDEEKFNQEKGTYREKIIAEKKNTFVNEWFEKLKQDAKPESYITDEQRQ
ncbi:MAG: peptidyl-prolyl cis-trans isomerase [Candidatus Omnitrophica bacterium]|nr:peptidyl-prolyl cis-trans isomerase [Candidatus Omnitrophota bacterium]